MTVTDGTTDPQRSMTITIMVPVMDLQGNTLFVGNDAAAYLTSSIVSGGNPNKDSPNCKLIQGGKNAQISLGDYNLVDDTSCPVTGGHNLMPGTDGYVPFVLGPLQDNNWIDFDKRVISGYTESHALLPGNPAIDRVPLAQCGDVPGGAATMTTIDLAAAGASSTVSAGDLVVWTNSLTTATVALNDGEANVVLIDVPPGSTGSQPYQFTIPGTYSYRVYGSDGAELSKRTVTVQAEDAAHGPARHAYPTARGLGIQVRCGRGGISAVGGRRSVAAAAFRGRLGAAAAGRSTARP